MPVEWKRFFAERTQRMQASDIREILKVTAMPDIISLAGGLPAPEVFPVQEFRAAFDKVLAEKGGIALQYSASEGYLPLREFLAERLGRFGTRCTADNVLITSGSQQALDLLGKIFLNPGDKVLVEKPSYLGAIQAFDAYQADYVLVPMDEDGMVTENLDGILAAEPVKLIYALPNFQNPSGRTMSLERRQQLIAAANRRGVPIVEDDPYGELRYEGSHLPSLKSMDSSNLVIGLGTFSKILAPGLRLAWMVLPDEIFETFVLCKQPADLHTSTLTQMATWEICRDGFVDRHMDKIKSVYHQRRDTMLDALEAHFPLSARWTRPEGGMFVWAELPDGIDTRDLLVEAVEQKVAFVPGQSFHADGTGTNTMRLNFSNVSPERLKLGIERLGVALERRLSKPQRRGRVNTVVGIFDHRDDAQRAIEALKNLGLRSDDIGITMRDKHEAESLVEDTGTSAGAGAATGALAGGALGGLAGWLVGIGALAIPGIGPIVAAGPLAAALTGAAVGAAGGGLLGALTGMGVPEHEARWYESEVGQGGILVTARADGQYEEARRTMLQYGAREAGAESEIEGDLDIHPR